MNLNLAQMLSPGQLEQLNANAGQGMLAPGSQQPAFYQQQKRTEAAPVLSQPKPTDSLPIKVCLDFSDEKSQNLFIFEQKYNMKKNDYFNLEKQTKALQ